ncbi:MAG: hypothetical protein JSW68_06815 [Burkholderiales bacterium]|nr:MAG: hypothetical protein JSW68_06815 [Burkholderiales bacterium]
MKSGKRNTRREALAMLAAFGVAPEVLAQDAVTTDPRSFRVVLENERVRVVEYNSKPGLGVCGQGMHSHPDRVTVVLTPAKVRVTNAKGESVVRDIEPGQVFFARAETHAAENVGGAGARIYIIELKDGQFGSRTG